MNPPSVNDRIMAALSHIAALATGIGLILPVLAWYEGRKKSPYVAFQSLQALGYQSLGYTLWLLFFLLLFIVFLLGFIAVGASLGEAFAENPEELSTALSLWVLLISLGSMAVYMLPALFGAVMCALGKDFRYPILGARLAKYLQYQAGDPDASLLTAHEQRWVAAMNHFAIILPLWGALPAIYAWVAAGKEFPYLKFQSVQTTIFHLLVNVGYYAVVMAASIVFFVLGVLVAVDPNNMNMALAIVMLATMCIFAGLLLLLPLFHIMGQWAGLQTLRGRNYRYPLAARLAGRWADPDAEPIS